jgi:hypothetical protein
MTCRNWREVVKLLDAATGHATPKQQKLGKMANKPIPPDTPRIVAAAMLRIAFAEELNLSSSNPISGWYTSRLQSLRLPSDPPISPQTEEEEVAWVAHLRLVRRRENLARLELNEGDIVQTKDGEIAEVSSISQDGRVFFKGGRGFGSWPDLISVVAQKDDNSDSAKEARRQAENSAARRNSSSSWSMARSQDLSEFIIERVVSEDDIAELETVIANAQDERPIQEFLGKNGHLLTALLGGRERYCIPKKRLGSEFVPDFIIGDVDSFGIRWVLVELETPNSGIYLKDGLELDEKARKGNSQVISWRDWLLNNIAYAHKRRSENGLGLFDIREKADAIVLVGRRSRIPKTTNALRRDYRQSNNIQIHSYDWLIESLRGAICYQGPLVSNPYLIPSQQISEQIF